MPKKRKSSKRKQPWQRNGVLPQKKNKDTSPSRGKQMAITVGGLGRRRNAWSLTKFQKTAGRGIVKSWLTFINPAGVVKNINTWYKITLSFDKGEEKEVKHGLGTTVIAYNFYNPETFERVDLKVNDITSNSIKVQTKKEQTVVVSVVS